MGNRFLSLWIWVQIACIVISWTVVVALAYLVTTPFDRVRYVTGWLCRKGRILLLILNPLWKVKMDGYRPSRRTHYVVVANHQSIADIPVLSYLPLEMKWLSKASNFKIPLLGWMMSMGGDIPLRRGDRHSTLRALERCRWYLLRHMSVIIFPEGTRSADGQLGTFKEGAFRLAIETKTPILPVVVTGTRDAIPKNSWIFKKVSTFRVRVLPPVEVTEMTLEELPRLKEKVREAMTCALQDIS